MGIAAIAAPALSARQKAAIIVRLVLAEGEDIDLARLPPELQTDLAQELALMIARIHGETTAAADADQLVLAL